MSLGNCSWLFKAVGSAAVKLLVSVPPQRAYPGSGGEEAPLPPSGSARTGPKSRPPDVSLGQAYSAFCPWGCRGLPRASCVGLAARSPAGRARSARARFVCVSRWALNCKSSRQRKERASSYCPTLVFSPSVSVPWAFLFSSYSFMEE